MLEILLCSIVCYAAMLKIFIYYSQIMLNVYQGQWRRGATASVKVWKSHPIHDSE